MAVVGHWTLFLCSDWLISCTSTFVDQKCLSSKLFLLASFQFGALIFITRVSSWFFVHFLLLSFTKWEWYSTYPCGLSWTKGEWNETKENAISSSLEHILFLWSWFLFFLHFVQYFPLSLFSGQHWKRTHARTLYRISSSLASKFVSKILLYSSTIWRGQTKTQLRISMRARACAHRNTKLF